MTLIGWHRLCTCVSQPHVTTKGPMKTRPIEPKKLQLGLETVTDLSAVRGGAWSGNQGVISLSPLKPFDPKDGDNVI